MVHNIAPAYAGVILKFVFWQDVPTGGGATHRAALSLTACPTRCWRWRRPHFCAHLPYYLVPGLLGMKTGLPLQCRGGFHLRRARRVVRARLSDGHFAIWLDGSECLLLGPLPGAPFGCAPLSLPHRLVCVLWTVAGAIVGFHGIRYLGRGGHLFALDSPGNPANPRRQNVGGSRKIRSANDYHASASRRAQRGAVLSAGGVFAVIFTYVIGFFATAGAAGADRP